MVVQRGGSSASKVFIPRAGRAHLRFHKPCASGCPKLSGMRTPVPTCYTRLLACGCALLATGLCTSARSQAPDWSLGVYGGPYYDSEPGGFLGGRAAYKSQYLLAVTGSKTLWRSATLPLALELDAMLGQQWGQASLQEVALVPVLRWSGFPWSQQLQTAVRVGPIGVSYTSAVSPLERGTEGRGSQWLSFLVLELALAPPREKSWEVFVRLHHRCAIYDTLNTFGANGEDFVALGYRHKF